MIGMHSTAFGRNTSLFRRGSIDCGESRKRHVSTLRTDNIRDFFGNTSLFVDGVELTGEWTKKWKVLPRVSWNSPTISAAMSGKGEWTITAIEFEP